MWWRALIESLDDATVTIVILIQVWAGGLGGGGGGGVSEHTYWRRHRWGPSKKEVRKSFHNQFYQQVYMLLSVLLLEFDLRERIRLLLV